MCSFEHQLEAAQLLCCCARYARAFCDLVLQRRALRAPRAAVCSRTGAEHDLGAARERDLPSEDSAALRRRSSWRRGLASAWHCVLRRAAPRASCPDRRAGHDSQPAEMRTARRSRRSRVPSLGMETYMNLASCAVVQGNLEKVPYSFFTNGLHNCTTSQSLGEAWEVFLGPLERRNPKVAI